MGGEKGRRAMGERDEMVLKEKVERVNERKWEK